MDWIELAWVRLSLFLFVLCFFLAFCLGMNECMNGPAGQGVLRYSSSTKVSSRLCVCDSMVNASVKTSFSVLCTMYGFLPDLPRRERLPGFTIQRPYHTIPIQSAPQPPASFGFF